MHDNGKQLDGLGRRIRLKTKVDQTTTVVGYSSCYIQDGQFQTFLNGFGRTVFSTGAYSIGWFREGKRHGYCRYLYANKRVDEGLYENGGDPKWTPEDISSYNTQEDLIA